VASISTHGLHHYTQGHIANTAKLGITYRGILTAGSYLSLVAEQENTAYEPCKNSAAAAVAAHTDTSSNSGPVSASAGSKTVEFDTTVLDHTKNFAVCYGDGTTFYDSGIRVTVALIQKLTYNEEQDGYTAGLYYRHMGSTNVAPASDTFPITTNIIAQAKDMIYTYVGEAATGGNTIQTQAFVSLVDATAIEGNPCADPEYCAAAESSNRTGPVKAGTGTRTVTFPQANSFLGAQGEQMFAVCYTFGPGPGTPGSISDSTWRDSYIRLKVSKVHSVESYAISHITTGMIASKPALSIKTVGTVAATSKIALVDETLNNYQPCVGAQTSLIPKASPSGATEGSEQQYSGVSTYNTDNLHTVPTKKLNADKVFAVCYTEGAGDAADAGWTDSAVRLNTPKVTSLSYGTPARLIAAQSCFGDDPSITLADCQSKSGSTAYYNALLPRASNVKITYGGPEHGTGLGSQKWIALIEQREHLGGASGGGTGQENNPCRDGNAIVRSTETGGTAAEGGKRLYTGVLQAATGTNDITIPQQYSHGGNIDNYLDNNSTFAVCYAETSGLANDATWRDSYIRVRFQKIHTVTASGVVVDTIGSFGSVPSLEVRWTGSLWHQNWLRFTSVGRTDAYGTEPCDKAHAGLTGSVNSTEKIQSGASSEMVTFDTSALTNTQNGDFFAVCYAEGDGSTSDLTWFDSGIRLRFIRWSNSAKSRVVSGAPMRMTFSMNMGRFDPLSDRVVLLNGKSDCTTAPTAVASSNASTRLFYHTCSVLGSSNVGLCDNDFDGIYDETCTIGAICDPETGTEGGCGTGGKCVGTIQLPSGQPYAAIHDTLVQDEDKLSEGVYAICICLGTSSTSAHGEHQDPASYGIAHGDGGCNTGNEYTRIFSPTVPGQTLKVISEPRLGRYEESAGQQTVRHVAGMSHKYHIKASSSTSGYQLADGDKIYFSPSSVGCGQLTKYSGPGMFYYEHSDNAYYAYSNVTVDRRWRTIAKKTCSAVDTDATEECDTDYDGDYYEKCVVGAFCDPANANNGGCGTNGACDTSIPQANDENRTTPISITDYDSSTMAGIITTPTDHKLTTVQTLVACFATAESLNGVSDVTDYVALQDGLEVIAAPRLGPKDSPGDIRALEHSSPSFTVNTMKYGDLIYFVPKTQTAAADTAAADADCAPTICTLVGASNVGSNCDATYDGNYDDPCTYRARCNPANNYNGGCGAGGTCEQFIPTVTTTSYTGLLNGTGFVASAGTGQINLPQLSVPPYIQDGVSLFNGNNQGFNLSTSWYLAACFVPAGAIQSIPYNVKPVQDMLTILKEPTDSLVTSWFQYNVQELRFTQPQQGQFGSPTFSTGIPGDIVVLKRQNCTDVHVVDTSSYMFDRSFSAKITLEEAGGETTGDEKGAMASVMPLAQGKVNELAPGIYKICYATKNSEGESQADFKELSRELEILPPPATRAKLTVPRTVMLGQDIIIRWESNIDLQTRVTPPNTWIGLYPAGGCEEENEWRHQCYVTFSFIEAGVESGTVRFSQSEYKNAGEYDVRYFVGDSRNGQGEICKGLTGVEHETYVQCMLSPTVTSSSIHIHGPDIRDMEDLDMPGMEVVFAGNRGRFN